MAGTIDGMHGVGLPLLVLLIIAGLVVVGVRYLRRRRNRSVPGPASGVGRTVDEATPTAVGSVAGGSSRAGSTPGVPVLTGPPAAVQTESGAIPTDQPVAVQTRGLTKRFDQTVAVDAVDLSVPRGSAFGYLGPNGAGKTTLMRTLLGLTHADGGSMALLDIPVPAQRREALARVGAIVDEPRFHPHLTGRENLRILAAARGRGTDERIGPALARVGLADRADHRVRSYSLGMRQRLGVAACLIADPELLVLDEPMNGLDPAGMQEMRDMIGEFVAEGRTVMLSSHLLDEIERTCTAVAIVDHGRVVRQGAIQDLVRADVLVVAIECGDPTTAAQLIDSSGAASVVTEDSGVTVTFGSGGSRSDIAETIARLVGAGVPVYGVRQVTTSLEDWFMGVTTRLGDQP